MLKKKNVNYKIAFLNGLVQGVVFAIVMALFDMWKSEPFSIFKFVLHFLGFGIIMVISHIYKQKKTHNKK